MAKKIVILDDQIVDPGKRMIRLCLWFDVPVGDELPLPGRSSSFEQASAAETTALQSGEVIEKVIQITVPATMSTADLKALAIDIYTDMENPYTSTQAAIGYPGKNYGAYWNGTSWAQA